MFSDVRASKGRLVSLLFLAFLLHICIASSVCFAQTTSGTLIGTVRDGSGKSLGRAKIAVVNEENGNIRATRTDDGGNFSLFNLPPGIYRATASKDGFLEQTVQRFPVQFNQKNVIRLPQFTLRLAALKGIVTDSAEIGLSEATVIVASPVAGVRRTATTDDQGRYSVSDLPPGRYLVTALWRTEEGQGLATLPIALDREVVSAPSLKLKEVVRRNASVTPQTQAPNVVVDGEQAASTLQIADPARSVNFTERQLSSLPTGGSTDMRSFDELTLLIAGVAPPPYTPGARGPGVGFGLGTAGQFSVNGTRARSNNFSVDGSDNNDPDVGVRRQGFVALVPQSMESVKEVSISTLLWDSELGRNSGAQVNAVSRYGGSGFHGGLYGFISDSSLNARNTFDTEVSGRESPFTRGRAGLTIGGPLFGERNQYFGSYEHIQINSSSEQHFSTPRADERSFFGGQPFGAQLAGGVNIFGPFVNTTPLGRNVLSFYPLPNNPAGPYGSNTFSQLLPADGRGDVFSFRVTRELSPSNLLNARYNLTDDRRILPSVNRALRSTLDSRTRSHNLSLIMDTSLTPTLVNQARFSFGRTQLNFVDYPGTCFVFSASSNTMVPVAGGRDATVFSQTGPIGELVIEPFSPVGVDVFTLPQRRASNTFQYADTLSWAAGKHSIKVGANIRRYQLNSVQDRLYRPRAVYSGGFIETQDQRFVFTPIRGVELASLGVASSVLQTITSGPPNSTLGLRFTEYQLFINDNFRPHRSLTFDMGVRYEYGSVPTDVNNRIEDALQLTNLPAPGNSAFDSQVRTARYTLAVNGLRGILDGRTQIYEPDKNNFGPHFGFAFAPGDGRTAVRGGYGVYFDTTLGAVVSQSRNVFPNEIPVNVDPSFLQFDIFNLNNPAFLALNRDAAGNRVDPPVRLLSPVPCNQFGTCNQFGAPLQDFAALIGLLFDQNRHGGLAFTLPEKRLRTPYAQQWHITFEREAFRYIVFSAAYVGTKGTKLTRLTTPNFGPNVTPLISLQDNGTLQYIQNSIVRGGFISIPLSQNFCPPPALCPDAASRPIFTLGPYQIFEGSAASSYHAMQLEARKRYSRGFMFTTAYTWSHAIDDVSDVLPIAGAPNVAQDSLNLRPERGDASYDIRHRFAASLVWDMPFFGQSRRVVKHLFGNWQVASIFNAHSGQPFTLNLAFDANLDGNMSDRLSTTDGLTFFDGHGVQRISLAANRQFTDYFTIGQSGAVGRNTARGDGFMSLDVAFSKKFRITEKQILQVRAEFFNALNRANYGLPIRVLGAPAFGSAVDTVVPARLTQLGLKLDF